jgi:hypothetical protein
MVVVMYDRKAKSNRAQADYFELLVCKYICDKHNIRFAYSEKLEELTDLILKLPNGEERLRLQSNNLLKLKPGLDNILNFEITRKGAIIGVEWVGRYLIIRTTADINVKHFTCKLTKFSVKSIFKSGLGTIKNLGMRSIKAYLGIDFKSQYDEMWLKLRNYLGKFSASKRELKKVVLENEDLLKWAIKNGQKYQKQLNTLCFDAFNKLSNDEKVKLLNFILDADDPELYVIIANARGVVIYKPYERKAGIQQKIEAKEKTDVGYVIYINDVPTYRVQTNATNGIGISPFCQRIFFAENIRNE